MSASENFVARWARLKRVSGIKRTTQAVEDKAPLPAADLSAGSAKASIPQPRSDAAADEPFDPSSLPSIEAITVNTDIRGFLASRVPAELTRAALRRAWASDPAIRDFIGIAENQWDFGDPHAIPGFGPLQESDNVPVLLAQALGGPDKLATMMEEMPVSGAPSPVAVTDHGPAAPDQNVQLAVEASSPTGESFCGLADAGRGEGAAAGNDGVAGGDELPRRRAHGGALPR
jgi:chemotaxis response regulator CheB